MNTEKTLMDKATLKIVAKWLTEGGTSVSYVRQMIAEELEKDFLNSESVLLAVNKSYSKEEFVGLDKSLSNLEATTKEMIVSGANYLHQIGHVTFHNTVNAGLKNSVIALLDSIGVDVNDVDEQGCSHLVQDALFALKQAGFPFKEGRENV